ANRLEAETDYPVKVMERLNVQSITRTDSSETQYLYDFGQNASGIVEIELSGNKGDTVRLVPAELIDRKGRPNQKATGRPYYFTYILKGNGVEKWSPRFTYYGFRYVGVSGAVPDTSSISGNQPRIKRMTLLHTRNSAPETGTFHSSADLFNRINQLIRWAIKSNLQSVATDCPHREKLGWLEQTHLMGNGIHYNFDILPLYKKQVNDMMIAQTAEGLIPDIAPEYVPFAGGFRDSPEWGSAGVILPWMLYKWYGDTEAMKKAWPMMARYVAYLKSKSVNHILDYGLGDWFDLGPKSPGTAQLTPVSLTATAIYYYDVSLMQEMAAILGKEDEAKTYAAWADEIKAAFNAKFLDPESLVYSTGSQTSIAMPLSVGLVDQDKKDSVFRTLLSSVRNSGFALTAGDVGFHFLVKALSEGGAGELLYDMNARDDVPGYGYQLKKGATALTESWPALEQVSNNHLMLGHLMEWFYTGLAGIDQTNTSVAFREIKIAPQMVGKINEAGATFESPYGTISSHWKKDESGVDWEITIPVNTTAELWLSVGEGETVTESIKPLSGEWKKSQEGEKLVIKVGSGKYRFSVKSGK
ncbi:MAG TPA: family 78 glycoside hydrolase catalytic domain, partial [Prolixibacteraceae bacterium]|nr:family 78 glycoside hydrolase catalytic domain [Prolixibacteraceae bacterium]